MNKEYISNIEVKYTNKGRNYDCRSSTKGPEDRQVACQILRIVTPKTEQKDKAGFKAGVE